MIKIRYSPLPEGLHAQARREGGHTVIHLRPGLSSQQRKEALRRVRQTARMGHGPRLPAAGVALALAADRTTATVRNMGAAVRCHPFGTGMLAALVAGAVISYSLFVTVSVRIIYPQVGGVPSALPRPVPSSPPSAGRRGTRARQAPGTADPGAGGSVGAGRPGGVRGGSGPGSGRLDPEPTTVPPSSGQASPSAHSSLAPAPSASASASAGAGTAVGICVKAGPLGLCLSL